jgi:ABC-type branched-subunit amino acid transport system ATPase component
MTLLKITGLCKSFGGLRAVDGLSLEVASGEVVGLLGPNGSGKTTAMNLISGALRADAGEILFDGHGVARTFQLVRVLSTMTAAENVQAGMAFRPKPVFGAAAREQALLLLDRVGLRPRADLAAGDLTYIDQKRLELARALALTPQVLLLDEWLAGLNPSELHQHCAHLRPAGAGCHRRLGGACDGRRARAV